MINDELSKKFENVTGYKFDHFYKKYRPKLVWYLTKYTKSQEVAQDFADDAFAQALLKIENYNKNKSQIHTWIYKIAENLVKKDFKDKKKINMLSIDKDSDDNLNFKNIIRYENDRLYDKTHIEYNELTSKKADIIRETIYDLPEKYKKVMILREIENRPYSEISELCLKDYPLSINNETIELPSPEDFYDIELYNKGNKESFINFIYGRNEVLQMNIKKNEVFQFDKTYLDNIKKIEIVANDLIEGLYRTTTNLSTIKSQIAKGRQLIQILVKKKFKVLENLDF